MGVMGRLAAALGKDREAQAPAPAHLDRPCPQCGAPADRRLESNGFGARYELLCGGCGYSFGEVTR